MVSWQAGAGVVGALVLACTAAATSGDAPRVVLGTFDSRAVAIAYAGSEAFRTYLSGLYEELAQAKAAGNDARVAELEAFGPQLQERLHLQGYSTASVADILAHIEDELPALAARAGVDAIVSRWDLVYRSPSARFVDVTDLLVAEFDPDARTLQSAREIVEQEPVPADELRDDH